jgi:hypothetical protein
MEMGGSQAAGRGTSAKQVSVELSNKEVLWYSMMGVLLASSKMFPRMLYRFVIVQPCH